MRRVSPSLLPLCLFAAAAAPLSQARAPDARARLEALGVRESELSRRMESNRGALVHLLSALETLRRDPPPALIVQPQRARDAARAAILLRAIAPELQRRARAFAAEGEELRRVRRAAAEAGAELFAQDSRTAEARSGGLRLTPPPRPGDLAAPTATPSPAPAGTAPARLVAPVAGEPVRRFGEVPPGRPRQEGLSWTPPEGAEVIAPADGEVEFAGQLRGRSLVAVIRTGGGWRLVLSGLRRVDAPAGARVRRGSRLGEAAGGAEDLQLQLRRGAEPVDPAPLLAR